MPATNPKDDHNALVEFVLAKAESAPLSQRTQVYRGLANLLGDQTDHGRMLNAIAADLAVLDHQAREFAFMLKNPKPAKPSEPKSWAQGDGDGNGDGQPEGGK